MTSGGDGDSNNFVDDTVTGARSTRMETLAGRKDRQFWRSAIQSL